MSMLAKIYFTNDYVALSDGFVGRTLSLSIVKRAIHVTLGDFL